METAIREIDVSVGPVILTAPDGSDSVTLSSGEKKKFDPPESGHVAYAPNGARFFLTYETDAAGTEAARDQVGASEQPQERATRKKKGGSRTSAGRSKSTARATSKRTKRTSGKSSSSSSKSSSSRKKS